MQSSTPIRSRLPPSPVSAVPIRTTPAKASPRPTARYVVNFSLRNTVASTAMMIGLTWSSIEAVPASTWCSPSLRETL